MKKNYFLGTLMSLLMLVALPVNAQVESMVDFYGKYKFTADMTVTEAGKGLEANFSDNCDVIVSKATGVVAWDAVISGFAGASLGTLPVNAIDVANNQFRIANWGNNTSVWNGGLFMSNAEGIYPFGYADMPQLGELWFSYDPATLTITIPDFTLVTVNHNDASAIIVASFKNAKLTLVEAEKIEIADISGDWHATPAGTYGTKKDSELPAEYDFTLTKTTEESKKHLYTVDFKIGEYPTTQTTATFDGNTLTIAMDSLVFDAENNVYACSQWGTAKTKVAFTYSSETTLAMDDPLCLGTVVNGKTQDGSADSTYVELLQWYMNGTAKKAVPEEDKFDWAGTYKVKVADPNNIISADGGEYPAEFDMVVEYLADYDLYLITSFFGYDVAKANNGGIALTPSADNPNEATFATGRFAGTIESGKLYYKVYDGNGGTNPVSITRNEDGTFTIGDFFIQKLAYDENWNTTETPAVFYQGVTATKAEEPAPFTWDGTWTVTSSVSMLGEGECPETFDMVIEYMSEWDMYLITNFMGNDVATYNQGGILFTPDGNTATIKTGTTVKCVVQGEHYYKMYDADGGTTPLTVTKNEDGTLTISNFTVSSMIYDADWNTTVTPLAAYSNVKAEKKTVEPGPEPQPYDFAGVYDITATVVSEDGNSYPETFEMAVTWSDYSESYYITYFFNYDVKASNYGGVNLVQTGDNSASMATGKYAGTIEAGVAYYKLYDINGGKDSLAVTVNEDGSLNIADFTIYHSAFAEDWSEVLTKAATYTNVKAVKNGKDPVSIQTIEKAPAKVTVNGGVINIEGGAQAVVVYDIAGRVEFSGVASSVANLAKGIHIVKVGNNVVKVNVK